MVAQNLPIELLHKGKYGCCNYTCNQREKCRMYRNFLSMGVTDNEVEEIMNHLPNRFQDKIFWGNNNKRCYAN